MKITHAMIRDDVDNIVRVLKSSEGNIPSFFSIFVPGLKVSLCAIVFQAISFIRPIMEGMPLNMFALFPLLFSTCLAIFISFTLSSMMGRFLSLPSGVRESSMVIRFYSARIKMYLYVWLLMGLSAALFTCFLNLDPEVTCITQFVSLIVLYFISTIDLGRYDFSIFTSAISAWRGKEPDGKLKKPE